MKQLRKLIAVDWKRSIAIFVLTLITATTLNAQAQTQMPPHDSVLSNALFDTMLAVVVFLLIIIVVLADVLKNIGIGLKEKNKGNNKWLGLISLLLTAIPFSANAQEATTKIEETVYRIGGMEPVTFWSMLVLIGLEVTVLAVIIIIIRKMIGVEEQKDTQFIQKKKEQPSLLEWANASVPLEKESEVLLDHNYDGIRELDNDLPPWWKYGFYLTIIFACIYLTHYHITKTGDLQIAEYNNSLKAAELEAVEYRKKAANLIDETSVKLLTDAGSLAEGKEIFKTNCAQCHGPDGGGKVGPNLTDDYWLHGGAIKDVFKTIKNGYQDKGMIAWGGVLSPSQIEKVASYVKSLHGTTPKEPKEHQGVLFTGEAGTLNGEPIDSTAGKAVPPKSDSAKKE